MSKPNSGPYDVETARMASGIAGRLLAFYDPERVPVWTGCGDTSRTGRESRGRNGRGCHCAVSGAGDTACGE